MKKLLGVFVILIGTAVFAFAETGQNELEAIDQKKHQQFDQFFGVNVGLGGMKMSDAGIFTASLGVNYGFYLFDFMSINTGISFHTENYFGTNLLSKDRPLQTPLCFTIPIGIGFNIPKAEWLYTGVNFAVNIPVADLRSSNDLDAFSKDDVFFSLPIDVGIDFMKPGRGGSRLFLRVTPTFHNEKTIVPVGIVWQIWNWRVFAKKVEVVVPPVEVNVPPPVINIRY
jgi:hypothetical protein